MSEIFIIKNTGKGIINSLAPENVVPIKSAGSSDGVVITEDSDTVTFIGNGTAENPLSAKLEQIQIGNNLGLISLTDTPPATGKYRGDVATAGTYTNFKNSSGVALAFTQGELDNNFGFIYVAENVAEKILSKKPSNSVEGNLIAFSPNIYFDKPTSFSSKIVNGPITFVPIGSGAKINYGTCVRLIANGVNVPDFSRFKELSGSQAYDNTAGVLNVCFFYFDGIDAWLNLWQGVGTSNIDTSDLIPPTAPTVVLGEITSNSVQLSWSGATDNVAVTSFEVYKNGVLFDTVSASPLVVTGLSALTTYDFKVKSKDAAGNSSSFSNTISATTDVPSAVNVVFDSLSSATYNSGTNTLAASSLNTGGLNTTPISGDFEVYSTQLTYASVIALKSSTAGGYTWSGTGINVQFLICAFYYGGNLNININNNTNSTDHVISTSDAFVKLKRVGNDCQILTSPDGTTWTLGYTKTGIFTGVSNLYIQGIFAITQSNLMSLKKL